MPPGTLPLFGNNDSVIVCLNVAEQHRKEHAEAQGGAQTPETPPVTAPKRVKTRRLSKKALTKSRSCRPAFVESSLSALIVPRGICTRLLKRSSSN